MTLPLYSFTKKELQNLPKKDLIVLADYFHVGYDKSTKKAELIEKLLSPQEGNFNADGFPIPKYSARVQRIMDSKQEE